MIIPVKAAINLSVIKITLYLKNTAKVFVANTGVHIMESIIIWRKNCCCIRRTIIDMKTEPLKLEAPWDEVKERMKENNIELTDEDLAYKPGKEDELLERLQLKIKDSKEGIRKLIESISANTEKAG